jgi:hypothetical protein
VGGIRTVIGGNLSGALAKTRITIISGHASIAHASSSRRPRRQPELGATNTILGLDTIGAFIFAARSGGESDIERMHNGRTNQDSGYGGAARVLFIQGKTGRT